MQLNKMPDHPDFGGLSSSKDSSMHSINKVTTLRKDRGCPELRERWEAFGGGGEPCHQSRGKI